MQTDQGQVNQLDSREWHDYASQSPDEKIPSEQSVCPDGYVLHALQSHWDQSRDDECVENDR
jgi:hypothetical protein